MALTRVSPAVAAIAAIAAAAVIGRQLRAMENLAHEASHFNWSRHWRTLNDVLAFALVLWPTGVRLRDYRRSHLLHHGRFGSADDPDRTRYEALGIEQIDRTSRRRFAGELARRLPRYQCGWLSAMGSNFGVFAAPATWAVSLVAAPAVLMLGFGPGLLTLAVWLAGYLVALPVLRFVAEGNEHIYATGATVFDATISSLGWFPRWVFHPHNDGYHTVHHMWPGIPHHQLKRVHHMLLEEDPVGYGQRLWHRNRVLEDPRQGLATPSP